jgi:hypothetical protein
MFFVTFFVLSAKYYARKENLISMGQNFDFVSDSSCLLYQRSAVWCIIEQLSGVPEISCLVYQRAAVWCTKDQLSGVPEISCLMYQSSAVVMYHRAAVWCKKGFAIRGFDSC